MTHERPVDASSMQTLISYIPTALVTHAESLKFSAVMVTYVKTILIAAKVSCAETLFANLHLFSWTKVNLVTLVKQILNVYQA